jgi:predicted CxxxxCH...CXXCH cytochrome family protein
LPETTACHSDGTAVAPAVKLNSPRYWGLAKPFRRAAARHAAR